jgi:hypothetical protein
MDQIPITSSVTVTSNNLTQTSTNLITTTTNNSINVSIPNLQTSSATIHHYQQQTPILQNTSTTALVQPMIFNQSTLRSSANTTNIPQQTHKMRKEIYRYTCEDALFAAAWSNKIYEDRRFRLVAGTLLDDEKIISNKVIFLFYLENQK